MSPRSRRCQILCRADVEDADISELERARFVIKDGPVVGHDLASHGGAIYGRKQSALHKGGLLISHLDVLLMSRLVSCSMRFRTRINPICYSEEPESYA
jgi:hypothetical protein